MIDTAQQPVQRKGHTLEPTGTTGTVANFGLSPSLYVTIMVTLEGTMTRAKP